MSFAEGWFQETIERFAAESDTTAEEIFAELNAELGLELPEDAETLLGDAIAVAVSPDVDLGTTSELLDDGGLGGSDPFEDVIEEAGQAGMLLFIDFDAGSNWLAELAADDPEVRDNLDPLAAFGLSAWLDGDVAHGALRITTD